MRNLLAIAFVIMNFSTFSNADVLPENVLPPEVVNIQLKSFTAEENRAVLEVSLYNPNDFKLPVREAYGDIYLNNNAIATIEALGKKSLGAHETQLFTVPVIVRPDQLVKASTNVILSGAANYRFKGYMMSPVGEIPIEHQGQLTAEQILSFFQSVMAIRQLL
ncbi:MAG: LEA14-like dessication related protein [Methylophagaceae bacterium]|jgi:LEA14-like dessication related protein